MNINRRESILSLLGCLFPTSWFGKKSDTFTVTRVDAKSEEPAKFHVSKVTNTPSRFTVDKVTVCKKVIASCKPIIAACKRAVVKTYHYARTYAHHWNWHPRWSTIEFHLRHGHKIDPSGWSEDQMLQWHDNYHDTYGP